MSEGKQIAVFMQVEDLNRLERLTKLITPLKTNKSMVIQIALEFVNMHLDEFDEFVKNRGKQAVKNGK